MLTPFQFFFHLVSKMKRQFSQPPTLKKPTSFFGRNKKNLRYSLIVSATACIFSAFKYLSKNIIYNNALVILILKFSLKKVGFENDFNIFAIPLNCVF